MKILIIENEFSYIDTPFHYINDIYFDNSIEYTIKTKSQDIKPFTSLSEYDMIFLDISLATTSILDGFGILKRIKAEKIITNKIIILTGNHLIEEKIIENNISEKYQILTKPIDFEDLLKILKD